VVVLAVLQMLEAAVVLILFLQLLHQLAEAVAELQVF
jgi:hypothetical protein